jgi:capsule polysaccharide modification protein KpsS
MQYQVLKFRDNFLYANRPKLFSDLPFYDHVLLLQGPIGGFFSKLASYFQKKGSVVYKINFNAGDKFFYKHKINVLDFNDIDSQFEIFIEKILKKHPIKAIFLFGDKKFGGKVFGGKIFNDFKKLNHNQQIATHYP